MTTATTTKPTAKKAPKTGSTAGRREARVAAKPVDVLKLIKQDHEEVKKYFKEYENLENDQEKKALAQKICMCLTVHAEAEEAVFYPAAREAFSDDDILDEATVEHASAKQMIKEIESMNPGDDLFDAKVKVLGEYINHHVEEEEGEMFTECRDNKMDLKALGEAFAAAKEKSMAAYAKKK